MAAAVAAATATAGRATRTPRASAGAETEAASVAAATSIKAIFFIGSPFGSGLTHRRDGMRKNGCSIRLRRTLGEGAHGLCVESHTGPERVVSHCKDNVRSE